MKTANRAAEKPAVESASNRQDFAQNGDGHFLGCLRAEGQANRASHAREARRRRDIALSRQAGEQFLIPRAGSKHADVGGLGIESEVKALLIALDMIAR